MPEAGDPTGRRGRSRSHGLVVRQRLLDRLDAGLDGPLTLVSAPAGSGKTTLVASWLERAAVADRAVWVSAQRSGRDATRFWSRVLDELQSRPRFARATKLQALTLGPGGADETFVERLADGLVALDDTVLLVIDDVHDLDAAAADGLRVLLDRRPAHLRIVLLTRRDPDLELHRMRLSGELTEIRAEDLRFSEEEARELLAGATVRLAPNRLTQLCARTEGWAAGLRLAALALAGRADADRFVEAFSGSERTVADYLMAEVLAAHGPDVRDLLLRTCLLEQVSGPLAQALTGRPDGERVLRELEDANALVTSVDADRSWFRYHHLLADFLRAQLRAQAPDEIERLHGLAADWLADHGFPVPAIGHAEAARDWDRAIDLLTEHWFSLHLDGERTTIHALLAALPDELIRDDAELATLVAADCLADGRQADADAYLTLAGRLAERVPAARVRRLSVIRSVVELARARSRGDFEAAVEAAHAILSPEDGETWADVVPNADLRALALMHLGTVELWALRLEDAEQHLASGVALAEQIDRPYVALHCLVHGAEVALMQSRQQLAERRARAAIELAERHGLTEEPVVGIAYSAMSGFLLSAGRVAEGQWYVQEAERLLTSRDDLAASMTLRFRRGWLLVALGRFADARTCFEDAARIHAYLRAPHYLSVSAATWALRAAVRVGDLEPARAGWDGAGEEARRRVEWCSLGADLRLAEGDPQAAIDALAPVLDGTAEGAHHTFEIEARFLEAVARDRLGQTAAAREAFEHALALAEPEGYTGIVLTVPGARELLESRRRQHTAHPALLAGMIEGARTAGGEHDGRSRAAEPALEQPLSDRELTILHLLPTNLSAADIGAELYLSVHTVKTHMRRIYAKLDVHRRAEAVERARSLGLLDRRGHGAGDGIARIVR